MRLLFITRKAKDGVNIERVLEIKRLKLLRLVAGLFSVVIVLSAVFVPFGAASGAVSRWALAGLSSVLSRAELAGQYLLIGQARLIAARTGVIVDRDLLINLGLRERPGHAEARCTAELSRRLIALRALLMDVPRRGLCLLRRATGQAVLLSGGARRCADPSIHRAGACGAWRLGRARIERPPDKPCPFSSASTSPRYRAGGKGGWQPLTRRDRPRAV